MRIAVTADTHWGIHAAGDAATRLLVADLLSDPPDLLLLAGDQGAGVEFQHALALFDGLDCTKALVPGNHDVWVTESDARGDSLDVYQRHLPQICSQHGFHYLDAAPLALPNDNLTIVGSMNWYDYSWSDLNALASAFPDWEDRLRTKRFSRGRHNDARFVRWRFNDQSFTAEAVQVLGNQLSKVATQNIIVVAHHPPFRGLNFLRTGRVTPDGLLWDAFAGNQAVEDLLEKHAARVRWAFCGHTHRERFGTLGNIRGYNVGSDYPFKRLLRLDTHSDSIEAKTFDVQG